MQNSNVRLIVYNRGIIARIEPYEKEFPIILLGIGKEELLKNVEHIKLKTLNISGHLLGLLQLKHLAILDSPVVWNEFLDVQEALSIIKSHLKNKDLLKCQEDLLDNGLKQFAKL